MDARGGSRWVHWRAASGRSMTQASRPSSSIVGAGRGDRAQEPRAAGALRSTRARSIRPSCCAGSATSAPGAATCRENGAGRPALRHPVDRRDRRGLRRHRLHGVVPEHAGLVRRELRQSDARGERFGDGRNAAGCLGGTGLSNPMKSFFGIEKLKLKGRKVDGGYVVRGALPWVSNLGAGASVRHDLRARGRSPARS